MTAPAEMTGGCQCGRIRYAATIDSDDAYLCHCTMCRKATGGVAAAFRTIARADLRWTTQPPDYHLSSPIARRGFCARCGTPLIFEFREGDLASGDELDLTIGSFDDPARFVPRSNVGVETALAAWQDTAHLPGTAMANNPNTRDRWLKACGRLPD